MKQETNDIILKITTEWEQYETHMNWDVTGDDLVRNFANMMRNMTYPTGVVIDSLRKVADDLECDCNIMKNNEIEILDYGTTD